MKKKSRILDYATLWVFSLLAVLLIMKREKEILMEESKRSSLGWVSSPVMPCGAASTARHGRAGHREGQSRAGLGRKGQDCGLVSRMGIN